MRTAAEIADYVLAKIAQDAASSGPGATSGNMQAGVPGNTPTFGLSAVTPQPLPGKPPTPPPRAKPFSLPSVTVPKARAPGIPPLAKPPAPPKPGRPASF